jgi:PTH1 family peptidyl-tRNA hydrolase
MKLLVGLGNPGNKYARTRHNVGFEVIDYLAEGPNAGSFQLRFGSLLAEMVEGALKLLLVKPQCFMNLSGRPVREIVDFFQLPLEELLVVCDDINLPLGKLRMRARGTHGGHNGLRDIQQHLGTTEYSRLRIGVGSPEEDAIDHVLGAFRPSEKPVIKDTIALAAEVAMHWAANGVQASMNRYNSPAGDGGNT